ncbi:hypothetical protein [Kribbella sp. DT2]|uniref:hypothetical protein n=1 Tax=Kribbella sp. DT2 TaxID=3393427 RepID=UPI003CF96212
MDPELVQELKQLRQAIDRLRESFESATTPATQRDLPATEDRLRSLSTLFNEDVISDTDYEDAKATLLSDLVKV